jgi:NADH:ubiquinone oxidoreductase subunit F (NADH-binding)/NAD-dependent dihydropyrimidine dehydrogenase PreA subunit
VKTEDAPEVVSETVMEGKIIDRLLYTDPVSGEKIVHEKDIPFYKKQRRIVFGNNGKIDPTDISDYFALEGYAALSKVLFRMSPEEVIGEVKGSGLRGRGGGGFLTGLKWEFCHRAEGNKKYVICNADEGDPGAYMDRSLLEGNPHSVLEGMAIGAYAIGSDKGYVYVRAEYPLAVSTLKKAISQAKECGILGENIFGSGFDFDIEIRKGSGAFVCGEETSLIHSIEGKPPEPRQRPPFPAQSGLWGLPTNINNVETWANVPAIIRKGADWFSGIGTEKSKGTKVFSVVGKINNTGLVEVPMGITLREMIYDIGGGIPGGKKFKAVQTGGPSGGCIPEKLIDLPVDFDRLIEVGSMMGSGGMVIMDENTCMVDLAKYFTNFLRGESCGKCVPCREGLENMFHVLNNITEGRGREEDLDLLRDLAEVISQGSLCALGGTAANPVLSTLRYFEEEYEAHIKDKRCPAHVCKPLITYSIDEEKCTGCGLCRKRCPQEAVEGEKKKPHRIIQEKCVKCGICLDQCRFQAVKVE